MPKTIHYKSKINIKPDSYYTKDSPEKIRKDAKLKFNLREIKDEDLDKYDVNFYNGLDLVSFNAKNLIDTRVKEAISEQEAKDAYIVENFTAFNIEKVEVNNDSDILEIKKRPDFAGFITHPATNIMPDYYYFKIKAYFDYKNYKIGDVDYFVARDANRDSFYRESKSAASTVIYFPKTEENLSAFKNDFSTFEFEEIVDDVLIMPNDFFEVERIVIERITEATEFGKSIELRMSTLKDAKVGRFIDTKDFYKTEKLDLEQYLKDQKDNKIKIAIKNKSDKENKINEFLEKMAKIQDFIKDYKQGITIDYNRFPAELLENVYKQPSKSSDSSTVGDQFKFD